MSSFSGPVAAPLDLAGFQSALLAWFDAHARALPWRAGPEGRRDPYRVWVSEVLLQQTQVSRGLPYFERFVRAFPSVEALAAAPEEAVLKAWEGCGYYARARNLHRAAKQVAASGFPASFEDWLALPGVGPYTAAAVSSLSLNEARAVSDGNVRRVLARVLAERAPTDRWVQAQADALLFRARPGAWNEAVMDLGATVCTPKSPGCERCPVAGFCRAFQQGEVALFPAPKVRAAVQEVQAVALLIGDAREAVLERRDGSLLGGLMGLPTAVLGVGESPLDGAKRLAGRLEARLIGDLGVVTHGMTHRHVTLHVFAAEAPLPRVVVSGVAVSRLDVKALALHDRCAATLFPVT